MIPIDAFYDAIIKANNGVKEHVYVFQDRHDTKSFCSKVESTRRIEITDKQDNTVTVKLR